MGFIAVFACESIRAQQLPDDFDFIARLKALDNGLADVACLNLPESFLQHMADWEVRGSYRAAQHKIAPDPPPPTPVIVAEGSPPATAVIVRDIELPAVLVEQWVQYSFAVPKVAGFRAPLSEDASGDPWPFDVPGTRPLAGGARQESDRDQNTTAESRQRLEAATFVARHLPRDGLIRTVMHLMAESPLEFVRDGSLNLNRLRAVGVPIDLLAFFTVDQQPVASTIARWFRDGAKADRIDDFARRAEFKLQPSCRGFHVFAEDGSEAIGALRWQLPGHRYRMGEGDGSVLDVFRQAMLRLPDMPMTISLHRQAMPAVLGAIKHWNVPNPARLTLAPHPANVTQWAQDNAKSGTVRSDAASGQTGAARASRPVTLVPRYASRTELRTTFVPSDSFVFESLRRAGMEIVQSPLLFQGGNLLPVIDPRTGERIMLVGEAEIHRNVALGLTRDQVVQALTTEFGVARIEILPAISFHIDLDVTFRRCGAELVACVNDDLLASRIIYQQGVKTLAQAKAISAEQAAEFDAARTNAQALIAINRMTMALKPFRGDDRTLSSQFTAMFARGPLESPAANAQRFLVATETLFASLLRDDELHHPNTPARLRLYVSALKRQQQAREALVQRLTALGMTVHRVPGLNDHQVSANYINGIHLPGVYLMPAFGGWFETLDRTAKEALQNAFGPSVRIEPIIASMAQENDGGLHCMLGLYPPDEPN